MAITLTIGGVNMVPYVALSGYKWTRNDVDGANAGRTLDGTMHRDRISSKARLDITTRPLTTAEAATVLQAIKPEFVTVKFTSPETNQIVTATMYSNNVPVMSAFDRPNGTTIWQGFTFPLIEQ